MTQPSDPDFHSLSPWLAEADDRLLAMTEEGVMECLPVKRMGGDLFRLCCVPFLIYDVDRGDVVVGRHGKFVSLSEKSGDVGFRFIADEDVVSKVSLVVAEMGCSMERAPDGRVVAINVPVGADAPEMSAALQGLEDAGYLQFETVRTFEPAPAGKHAV